MVKKDLIKAFTLIELLVVMAIIAVLLSLVVPRYFKTIDHSKEKVLLTNLVTIRDSIDKYYGDKGHYPDRLEALVEDEYLREIPLDPITDSNNSWIVIPSKDTNTSGIYDIHSSASGKGANGKAYIEW